MIIASLEWQLDSNSSFSVFCHMLNSSLEETNNSPARKHPENVSSSNQHGHGQMNRLNGKTLIPIVDWYGFTILESKGTHDRHKNQEDYQPKVSHDSLSTSPGRLHLFGRQQ
jgi:hypothetical protein